MSTLTVFSDTTDGYLESTGNTTYSTARAMSSIATTNTAGTIMRFGQRDALTNNFCSEAFAQWDTSSLTAIATVTAVTVSLYGDTSSDVTNTDFSPQCRLKDWGTSLTSADAVAGASLSGLTLLASITSTSSWTTSGYNAFTESGTDFQTNINKTGSTRVLFNSSRMVAGNDPTNNEYLEPTTADQTGTTKDPKLVVTYTARVQRYGYVNHQEPGIF